MFQWIRSFGVECAKRGRLYLNNHGYDFHPVDHRCWDDQAALLGGRKKPVVFDVGANGGIIATQYRKIFPDCWLYCFEPQEAFLPSLKSRFPNDPNVSFHFVAVGAAPGKARFYLTAGRDSSSLLGADYAHAPQSYRQILTVTEEKEVDVITLDDFTREQKIDRIDILKMDIQGGEYAALEGATRLLSEARIALIYLEGCFVPLYANQPLLGDIAKCLARYDYTFHLFYHLTINGRSGRTLWCDAIFVSPELYNVSREHLKKGWGGNGA
jgi:FkbM family methyltransferase